MKLVERILLLSLICVASTINWYGQGIPEIGNPSNSPVEDYANSYNQARDFLVSDTETALSFARDAVHYAEITRDSLKVAKACYLLGMIQKRLGDNLESYISFNRASINFQGAGNAEYYLLSEWAKGYSLYTLGAYEWSKEVFVEIKEALSRQLDEKEKSKFFKDLGNSYYKLNEYELAKQCYQEAYQGAQLTTREGIEFTFHIGRIQKHQGEIDSAENTFRQVIEKAKVIGDLGLLSLAHNDLAVLLEEEGQDEEAKGLYREAYTLANNQVGNSEHEFLVATNLAALLLRLEEFEAAKHILSEIILATDLEKYHYRTFKVYDLLSRVDQKLIDYSQLTGYQDIQSVHVEAMDLENKALKQALREEEVRRELAKFTTSPTPPEKPTKEWPWFIVVGVCLILMGILLYLLLRAKQVIRDQTRKLNARQQRNKEMAKTAVAYQKGGPGTQIPDI